MSIIRPGLWSGQVGGGGALLRRLTFPPQSFGQGGNAGERAYLRADTHPGGTAAVPGRGGIRSSGFAKGAAPLLGTATPETIYPATMMISE